MVIHRSRFPKRLDHIARGRVTSSGENFFQVSRTKEHRDEKGNMIKTEVYQRLERGEYNTYHQPNLHTEVMLRYKDSKSRNLTYGCPEKNLPFEVLTLNGELIYRSNFV